MLRHEGRNSLAELTAGASGFLVAGERGAAAVARSAEFVGRCTAARQSRTGGPAGAGARVLGPHEVDAVTLGAVLEPRHACRLPRCRRRRRARQGGGERPLRAGGRLPRLRMRSVRPHRQDGRPRAKPAREGLRPASGRGAIEAGPRTMFDGPGPLGEGRSAGRRPALRQVCPGRRDGGAVPAGCCGCAPSAGQSRGRARVHRRRVPDRLSGVRSADGRGPCRPVLPEAFPDVFRLTASCPRSPSRRPDSPHRRRGCLR